MVISIDFIPTMNWVLFPHCTVQKQLLQELSSVHLDGGLLNTDLVSCQTSVSGISLLSAIFTNTTVPRTMGGLLFLFWYCCSIPMHKKTRTIRHSTIKPAIRGHSFPCSSGQSTHNRHSKFYVFLGCLQFNRAFNDQSTAYVTLITSSRYVDPDAIDSVTIWLVWFV